MRAGLEKLLVRREVGEKRVGNLVVPVTEPGKEGRVVWGEVKDIGPRGKAGHSFGHGSVAYDNRAAKVVERGEGYVLEVIAEEDVLAFRLEKVDKPIISNAAIPTAKDEPAKRELSKVEKELMEDDGAPMERVTEGIEQE